MDQSQSRLKSGPMAIAGSASHVCGRYRKTYAATVGAATGAGNLFHCSSGPMRGSVVNDAESVRQGGGASLGGFCERGRSARLSQMCGLSQAELAKQTGIGRHAVSDSETKARFAPNRWALVKMANALGLVGLSDLPSQYTHALIWPIWRAQRT